MTHHFVSRESGNRAPGIGQQNRWIADKKDDAHHQEELQKLLLAQTPTRRRHSLNRIVVSDRNSQQLRNILRRHHGPETGGRSPVVPVWTTVRLAFRDALAAQPEHIHEQEKENEKRVFLSDPIEADGEWIECPKRSRD